MNANICDEVIKMIKEKRIKPKPRWEFLLKNYLFFGAFLLSIMIGGLAMSVIIFMIQNGDWDLYERLSGTLLNFIFITLPYFWLVIIIFFIFIADFYYRHTKTGYRHSLIIIVTVSVGASAVLGTAAHFSGLGEIIVDTMSQRIPVYEKLNFNRAKMWIQPEKGILAGTIINIRDNHNFDLNDFTSRIWIIDARETKVKDRVRLHIGENIKLIGEILDDQQFKALEIRAWGSKCIMERCNINSH